MSFYSDVIIDASYYPAENNLGRAPSDEHHVDPLYCSIYSGRETGRRKEDKD